MGVDDDGAELAIKRATDASRCSDALERENGELFECEKGREWCTRNTSTIHKNVLCQCAALIEFKKKKKGLSAILQRMPPLDKRPLFFLPCECPINP